MFISHPLRRLIRFEAYGILFPLAGIFGALVTLEPLDYKLFVVLVFIAASSAFGFVINDISDMALGARAGIPRNPLADGSLARRTAQQVSAFFLVLSVICMVLLPAHLLLIELAVLFVFVTYSFFVIQRISPGSIWSTMPCFLHSTGCLAMYSTTPST